MIFIAVKFAVRPEHVENWVSLLEPFTTATLAEPGNLFFEWSRSVADPTEYVLLEAFTDGDAGAAHVGTDHFKAAIAAIPDLVRDTPQIINVEAAGAGWGRMAELSPSDPS